MVVESGCEWPEILKNTVRSRQFLTLVMLSSNLIRFERVRVEEMGRYSWAKSSEIILQQADTWLYTNF